MPYAMLVEGEVRQLFDDDPNLPESDRVSVISVGTDVQVGWTQQDGALAGPLPVDLPAYAAAARYARSIGGFTANGIEVDTSDASQSKIGNAYLLMQASGAASINFKAADGAFHTMTADQFKALAIAVGGFVQACYGKEAEVITKIKASPPTITSTSQIDTAFAAVGT